MNAYTENGIREVRASVSGANPLEMLCGEMREALSSYWETAGRILSGSGIALLEPPDGFFSLERNFFSALFLYSYQTAGISQRRRVLYALINQCLRGMVTGCDNILDNEYKATLETDLPQKGVRFRSVIDIMASDRVLFEALLTAQCKGEITADEARLASSATLKALGRSGAEEAGEEGGVTAILEPEEVLTSVHHYKTGVLFQCPWAVPAVIERIDKEAISTQLDALYAIGMGCQILDDMVDLASNTEESRHNYVVSLIWHGRAAAERERLESILAAGLKPDEKKDLASEFPVACAASSKRALEYLKSGLTGLFGEKHGCMAEPAAAFLIKRIGAERFISGY